MVYINYFRYLLLGLLITCIIFIGAVFYQMGAPTQASRWIYQLDTAKSSYAKSIESPKLLLVSGSNTLYGVSCQIIQQKTGVPCVNTALTQELGLAYILSHARSLAKAKDTILLPLEYQLYMSDGTPSELSIDYIWAYSPSYLKTVDLVTKVRLMGGISYGRLLEGIFAKLKPLKSEKNDYKNRINLTGDITDKVTEDTGENHGKSVSSFAPFNLEKYILKKYSEKRIAEFVGECKKNNINVIATWPSTVLFEEYKRSGTQEFFQSIHNFYMRMGVPVVGIPEDFMYDRSLFFNSVYHLNDKGRRQRTQQIIDAIHPYLKAMKAPKS